MSTKRRNHFLFLLTRQLFLLLFLLAISTSLQGQIEKVIVETYYISDAADATDTTGGGLDSGSVTYRIYIDLKPGSKLRKIYGDANHPLKISSSDIFFNNKDRDQTLGNNFSQGWFDENTVALDTWLTLGQTSKTGAKTYFGVLKSQDTDGSFIGGANNDGGSAGISGGLLANNNPAAGIPLTVADGMDTMRTVPSSWVSYGIKDVITGNDSTIFGSIVPGSQFINYNCALQNSGVMGVIPDSNQVLVAQLTTRGTITFELNIEVEEPNELGGTTIVKYVADDSTLLPDEKLSPYLKYPPVCGCKNPDYIEYSAAFACSIIDSCKTLIVFGCTDPLACNYNSQANFNVPVLCCYPGHCQDRDIRLVCPTLSINEQNLILGVKLFPNPAQSRLNVQIATDQNEKMNYKIYDSVGRLIKEKNMDVMPGLIEEVDISELPGGLYLFRISTKDDAATTSFIKN